MTDPKRKSPHQPLKADQKLPTGHGRHRQGRWLPAQDHLEDWLEGLAEHVRGKASGVTLKPAVQEFRELIEDDPIVGMYMRLMIEQVPHTKPYRRRHLESVDQMLDLIDEIIGRAPNTAKRPW